MMIVAMAMAVALGGGSDAQREGGRPEAIVELGRCRAINAADARLACFDAAAARVDAEIADSRMTILDREGIRATRRSLFGFPLPAASVFRNDAKEEVANVDGVIARVLALPNQRYELVLTDGARWQTTEPTRWTPAPNAKVQIRKAALGSYWIAVDRLPTIRGRRVG